jgi:hypothetical protein
MLYLCVFLIMPHNRHPCINISKRKSFGGLFHHLVEERINTKKEITKKMPCYNIGKIGCELR